jgi:uncharacterized protein (TIGR02217 family)
MSFFEVEFPRAISYKGVGGSGFNTSVNEGLSGFEQRNKNWATSRGKWTVAITTPVAFYKAGQTFSDLLNNFFLNVGGMADGFRLFDHIDNKGVGQFIGMGDGATRTFQLQKTYTISNRSYIRTISKPITNAVSDYQGNALPNTVVVYVGGLVASSLNYTVDPTTGVVTFNIGHAPAMYAIVTADFQFHYAVRFDADNIVLQREESNTRDGNPIISWASIGMKEIRIAPGQSQG